MVFEIAKIKIALHFSPEYADIVGALAEGPLRHYRTVPSGCAFNLHLIPAAQKSLSPLFSRNKYLFYCAHSHWVVMHHFARCVIFWKNNHAVLRFAGDPERLALTILDFIKLIMSFRVIEGGGIPLHSAAVEHNNRALVFFGPSEIGKSTIAGLLSPDWRIFNDELNVLTWQDGQWIAHSTPFTKTENQPLCSAGNAPVAGVFALRQGDINFVERMSMRQIIFSLMSCCYAIPTTDSQGQCLLETIKNIAETVGVKRLTFVNNRSILQDLKAYSGDSRL